MTDGRPPVDTRTTSADVLLQELRVALACPTLAYAEEPQRLGGGFWADIIAIRLTGAAPELSGPLVARLMPDAALGRRETIVQREVARLGFAAPAVRLVGESDQLGGPFMLMDRIDAAPLLSGLGGARVLGSIPRVFRDLPRQLASTALELHLLDPTSVVAALHRELPGASVDAGDQVSNLTRTAAELDVPLLVAATRWLAVHTPAPERVSICHGDLHPLNLLVDAQGRTTLVDWTASRISEPAYDLAFTTLMLRHAPLDVPRPLRALVRRAAAGLANRVLAAYRRVAEPHDIAVDDERLRWHTALQCTRVLAEVESWGAGDRPRHPFRTMAPALRAELAALTST